MFRSTGTRIWMAGFAAGAVALAGGVAQADWVLVDDFDSLQAGPIDGQNDWVHEGDSGFSTQSMQVIEDPDDPSNQVLRHVRDDENNWLWKDAGFTTGSTVTISYRWYMESGGHSQGLGVNSPEFGGSDSWWHFNARKTMSSDQHRLYQDTLHDADVIYDQWHNFWMVADYDANSVKLYRTPGDSTADATEDDLIVEGAFRLDDGNPETSLQIFRIGSSGNPDTQGGVILMDDVYMSADENLSFIPEPASAALLGLGGGLMLLRRRRTG